MIEVSWLSLNLPPQIGLVFCLVYGFLVTISIRNLIHWMQPGKNLFVAHMVQNSSFVVRTL